MMRVVSPVNLNVDEFLELVLMWHCAGDVPFDRSDTSAFIEDSHFGEFLMSVNHWALRMGVHPPTRSEIVKRLYTICCSS